MSTTRTNPDPSLPRGSPTGKVQPNKVFPHFILTVMPGGLRGLVLAGVLATTMGSLSTALNSLATSYVRDFHFRWFGEPPDDRGRVRVLRLGTVIFAALLIAVGSGHRLGQCAASGAAHHSDHPRHLRLHLRLAARRVHRRSVHEDRGAATSATRSPCSPGFLVVAYLSGLDQSVAALFGGRGLSRPDWMPVIEFPWRIMFGTLVTVAVALCFKTPVHKRADMV